MNRIINLTEENIVSALLEGAGLSSFIFHTHFQLVFSCDTNKKFGEKKIPWEVTLTVLGDWWFGNKEKWDAMVRKMTDGFHFVEPDEPVLAFKLAALRWMDGSTISSVKLTREKMEILFECGESVTILNRNDSQGDYPWEMSACGNKDADHCWSVICDEGEIYYSIPI